MAYNHDLRRIRPRTRVAATLAAVAVSAASGCGSVKVSGTERTGTEQLLLTNAWDMALQKIDFRPLTGVPVYLDAQHVAAVDKGWVISSIRQAMLMQGVLLRDKPEQAQWIVEARVGAYGTDSSNWLLGIPQTTVPPTVTGVPTGTIPEIPLVKKSNQSGVAKLALFAYDRSSGQFVWKSGTVLADANAKDVYIGGVGPIHSDNYRGTEFAGVRLPIGSGEDGGSAEDAPADDGRKGGRLFRRRRNRSRSEPSSSAAASSMPPPAALPPSATDLESFAP